MLFQKNTSKILLAIYLICFSQYVTSKELETGSRIGVVAIFSNNVSFVSSRPRLMGTEIFGLGHYRYFYRKVNIDDWNLGNEVADKVESEINKNNKYTAINVNNYFDNNPEVFKSRFTFLNSREVLNIIKTIKAKEKLSYLLVIGDWDKKPWIYSKFSGFRGVLVGGYGYSAWDSVSLFSYINIKATMYDIKKMSVFNEIDRFFINEVSISRTLTKKDKEKIFKFVSDGVNDGGLLERYNYILNKNYLDKRDKQKILSLYEDNLDSGEEDESSIAKDLEVIVKPLDYAEKYTELTDKDKKDLDESFLIIQKKLAEGVAGDIIF
ncbi:MAG: hypothetical protein OEZ33_09480 [Gammaproteobacteria bacterium]|nr:hypothetical protein [Gammaproteobacteria bacterium]